MNAQRINCDGLSIFKTFGRYRIPHYLEYQSKSGDLTILNDLPSLGLAIVGSRYPQKRSMDLLEKTIQELSHTDLIIISGFARGIDSQAHEMAIHYGLRTIAVLGCGINTDYPKENEDLRKQIIAAGGVVLSQFDPDAKPLARNFYERNGMIAGLSKAVWVVEAAEVSGTLNTAKWAIDFNRDLYATSCFPSDPFYQGNLKLLNHQKTDRYSVAKAFYSAESFAETWNHLNIQTTQSAFPFQTPPRSQLQKWVLELKTEYGECQLQSLMNYAYTQGKTPGSFYLEYEKDVKAGLIVVNGSGLIDII